MVIGKGMVYYHMQGESTWRPKNWSSIESTYHIIHKKQGTLNGASACLNNY